MELQCKVQQYDWGKIGSSSKVAQLMSSADKVSAIDESKPYAELWVGTHPSGPALIIERKKLLSEYLIDNQDAIGPTVAEIFGINIPFLLKVLSIRKALSIQAHPNKEHAELLHKTAPELYKDNNHKPELAIALTPFKALCGFRPVDQIKQFLEDIEELRILLSEVSIDESSWENYPKALLRTLFNTLMIQDKKRVGDLLLKLLDRLSSADDSVKSKSLYDVLKTLHADYPGDVGCWAIYFLNYMELEPGQAIYLGPNIPHAYLDGDCVECMACSDNVVRAGLTPKFIDVPTLVEMLDYSSSPPALLLFEPKKEDDATIAWRPPVADFAVIRITITASSDSPYNTIIRASPSFFLVVSGHGTACDTEDIDLKPGTAIFMKASRQLTLKQAEDAIEDLVVYQAICNVV